MKRYKYDPYAHKPLNSMRAEMMTGYFHVMLYNERNLLRRMEWILTPHTWMDGTPRTPPGAVEEYNAQVQRVAELEGMLNQAEQNQVYIRTREQQRRDKRRMIQWRREQRLGYTGNIRIRKYPRP